MKSGLFSLRFTKIWYSKDSWLSGCSHSGKGHCFPCLLFEDSQREKALTQSGVKDWKQLSEKVKRHVKCSCHVANCTKVAIFGKTNIAEQLSLRCNVSGTFFARFWLLLSFEVFEFKKHFRLCLKKCLETARPKTAILFVILKNTYILLSGVHAIQRLFLNVAHKETCDNAQFS